MFTQVHNNEHMKRNLTLKKRMINIHNIHKFNELRLLTGQYVRIVDNPFPIAYELGERIKFHMERKPKSISFRNWLYPCLEFNGLGEKEYQLIKEWTNSQSEEIIVEISSKLQHLAMCFDSPHFISCGSRSEGLHTEKANWKMCQAGTACAFIRDKSGKIKARNILRYNPKFKVLEIYSFYGDERFRNIIKDVVETQAQFLNCGIKHMGSFL